MLSGTATSSRTGTSPSCTAASSRRRRSSSTDPHDGHRWTSSRAVRRRGGPIARIIRAAEALAGRLT
ncbi:hypothetical protein NI26_03075 [Curtobacterium sp. MR_MD2014]|nr:hypothetical protein NI26_03075 [Curtobacterium sp. MR_MD2014]